MSQRFDLSRLTHDEVDRGLAQRVAQDRVATAELIAYLGEVGARGRHLTFGYRSLYDYCTQHFGMSEDVAKKRIRVARLARRHPVILERLADGGITLTALLMMSHELFSANTPEQAVALLDAARGKTNERVALLLAGRSPKPDTPTRVRPLSAPVVARAASDQGAARPPVPSVSPESFEQQVPLLVEQDRVLPASPPSSARFEFRTTLDAQTLAELQEAAELLSHVIPNGDLGLVLARLVRMGLEQARKQRQAATKQPRAPRAPRPDQATDNIPEHIVRAVYARDEGRCTYRGADGHTCASRWQVELDHVVPRSKGGESSLENLRLLCRAHNQHEAERVLGAAFMRGKRAWAARRRRVATPRGPRKAPAPAAQAVATSASPRP